MTEDKAGVIAPPPVIAAVTIVLAIIAEWLWPSDLLPDTRLAMRLLPGAAPVAAGVALAVAGERRFAALGTNPLPWKPATVLVTHGVYAHVRNPMYVGLGLAMFGLAVAFSSVWLLALTVPAALVLHFGVVLREERYLTRKFGEPYLDYMRRVPRYLPRAARRAV